MCNLTPLTAVDRALFVDRQNHEKFIILERGQDLLQNDILNFAFRLSQQQIRKSDFFKRGSSDKRKSKQKSKRKIFNGWSKNTCVGEQIGNSLANHYKITSFFTLLRR